jgi:CTP-dependent riboflavin kinase
MTTNIRITGTYSSGTQHSSSHWAQVCADHEDEFPLICECAEGTFNVCMTGDVYVPPNDEDYRLLAKERGRTVGRYEDGNHLSPRAKVVQINGKHVEAWIYRGGHNKSVLELVSRKKLVELLNLTDGEQITVVVMEISEEKPDMPKPPPKLPGKTVCAT